MSSQWIEAVKMLKKSSCNQEKATGNHHSFWISPCVVLPFQVLLNSGAPTDQLDCDGNAPLHSVCSLPPFPSQLDCIRSLVSH